MARRSARRLVIPSIIALLLAGALASVAFAWDATCSCGEACVWKNSPFTVPLAAQAAGDDDYTNNNYPNTSDTINDSVSSVKNRFASNDVVWHFDVQYGGTPFCLNAGWEADPLNSHNDQYSSHLIAISSTCP